MTGSDLTLFKGNIINIEIVSSGHSLLGHLFARAFTRSLLVSSSANLDAQWGMNTAYSSSSFLTTRSHEESSMFGHLKFISSVISCVSPVAYEFLGKI